ncbi:MAG: hypothetical protein IPH08_02700 [Rhodocyclaceae bacterium]|nr:hypothetical protein [Rhodocyclaceae bacterium]
MKLLYLAWSAVVADFWVFLTPQPYSTSASAMIATVAMHGAACAVLATVSWFLLPQRYRYPRPLVWLLMFNFSFVAPFVGPVVMLLICHTTLHQDIERLPQATPLELEPLEYNVQSKVAPRSSQGAIRSRLTSNVPANIRMQSLLTLQAVPKRVANPLLEDLLADDSDDVRLVAFGMLDAEEKKLSVHIQRERRNLEHEMSVDQRYTCLRYLAELHWELTYTALAQGEMRKYMLGEARRYINEAITLQKIRDPSLTFLRARVLLAQGDLVESEVLLYASLALGQSAGSVRPYLAEMAFRRHDMAAVHLHMNQLDNQALSARVQRAADLWTGRDSFPNPNDRNTLAHI